ncbi:SU10 major capsid protein [Bosea sp. TAF32]|uniref:SU10 major capsid protein n=1 Tax=Bosea sp. TAF32 TaxID=3237482 RepID=UPI003F916E35
MATYTTYDVVGAKEDVSDIITNLSPADTPFQSMIGKEKIKNKIVQWQEDALRAVAVNAKTDGHDAADVSIVPTTMRQNYSQILSEAVKIADGLEAIDRYGRAKEAAYQMDKTSKQLKRDLEHAFVGTKQTAVVGSSSVARQLAGVQAQIAAGNIVVTGGASTPLSAANVKTAQSICYTAGSNPDILMVTPADTDTVAGFNISAGRTRSVMNGTKDRAFIDRVDLVVGPLGELAVIPNRFLAAGDSLVFETDMWKNLELRPWTRETLAKNGDATTFFVKGEFSLKHKHREASALIRRST